MLDVLKKMAFQKLQEKLMSNSLSPEATTEAAEEGSSAIVNIIMEQIQGGGLSTVTSLFSNDGNATEENGIFQTIVGKLSAVLQNKGMSVENAQEQASNIAPSLVDDLKEKFLSNDSGDSAFDLTSLAGLVGGDAGGLMDTAKGLF